ncbi:helix-turn-helix domain-containing protein [Nocardioides sp. CER19]|uniref:helix-turn-helix domain-containing protein n=1 Tax=Nocardioides sp. CER19 TaxID=3038538 RepID=UPI00244912E6|nr:helix-turn-helix domain-containing protein [Nocardioides sp. CER19]MDH2415868.1 helix-turn-helix domain-containing protein [Nocardioides sp. CER19]
MSDIQIGRNGRLAAVVGGVAGVLALAFLVRHHGVVDLALGLVLLAIAGAQLWSAWDARTPLLVADDHGVRVRLGRVWQGIPWRELDEVEHLPRRSWWRDGRLVLLPQDDDAQMAALPAAGRRHATLSQRLYGAPFAVPLGLTTVVAGGSRDLSTRLADLAGDDTTIVEIDPGVEDAAVAHDGSESMSENTESAPEPTRAVDRDPLTDTAERPAVASPTPSPLREPTVAVRAEVTRDFSTIGANALKLDPSETDDEGDAALPEAGHLHRPFFGWLGGHDEGVTPIAKPGEPVEPLVVEDLGPTPAAEPVIGPELAAARTRIGLSVDQLAERTRIRPHVIEAIEVDDFGPCGGDFYARGHLRTLARVLGIDAPPLLQHYDATYADAPIDPRRVFESELATGAGGPIRRMKGGPNWSVLVAAVMAIVLAWSIARLVLDGSSTTPPPAPSLGSGSAGTSNPYGKLAPAVPVTISAAGGGAEVVVRDGSGDVVFSGSLAFGESKTLRASPPVRIQASDGSTTVAVDGGKAAPVGKTGQAAQQTYTAD